MRRERWIISIHRIRERQKFNIKKWLQSGELKTNQNLGRSWENRMRVNRTW